VNTGRGRLVRLGDPARALRGDIDHSQEQDTMVGLLIADIPHYGSDCGEYSSVKPDAQHARAPRWRFAYGLVVSHGMAFGHLRAATDALPYRKKSASCSWRA